MAGERLLPEVRTIGGVYGATADLHFPFLRVPFLRYLAVGDKAQPDSYEQQHDRGTRDQRLVSHNTAEPGTCRKEEKCYFPVTESIRLGLSASLHRSSARAGEIWETSHQNRTAT